MLGGDWSVIPVRYLHSMMSARLFETPSDLYYAALDGSMNTDGDHMWGDDPVDDYLPEIMVGRLPFWTQPM
jgi:hypothetical protein